MPRYLPIPELTPKQIARFWSKVACGAKNECWPWVASCSNNGYGQFWLNKKQYGAHRVALAIVGNRNNVLEVRHNPIVCNNKRCVNPKHLCFGTHKQNMGDMAVVGTNRGSRHSQAKFTEFDILIIRKLAETMRQIDIAKMFNVSRDRIWYIVHNKHWTHVIGVATNMQVEKFLLDFCSP